jgi:acetyltransferase
VRSFDHTQLARMTQIDYDREMALVASVPGEDGRPHTLGVVRAVADPDNETAEFAVTVLSTLKGRGLGRLLMERIIGYALARDALAAGRGAARECADDRTGARHGLHGYADG